MTGGSQTASGRGWEEELTLRLAYELDLDTHNIINRRNDQSLADVQYNLIKSKPPPSSVAAKKSVEFLLEVEPLLQQAIKLIIPMDQAGASGDVRDIRIKNKNGSEIGISAKKGNDSIKHSRLSDNIDFGKDWYGVNCSQDYWDKVRPVFKKLRERTHFKWNDLDREEKLDIYDTILTAFMEEVVDNAEPTKFMRYILGRQDYYMIIRNARMLSIKSFNMDGTLSWGSPLHMPSVLTGMKMKENSKTTAVLTTDAGWKVSFRIHNANSNIEPSLKFDVKLIGFPDNIAVEEIQI